MNILLTAINAKYIHSNLAVYSLKAAAGKYTDQIELAEYTINHQEESIFRSVYQKKPDLLFLSCYIWNRSEVRALAENIHKVLPDTIIWAGGPEVSYDAEAFLKENPAFTGVMIGEGEQTFPEVLAYYIEGTGMLENIQGIAYREAKQTLNWQTAAKTEASDSSSEQLLKHIVCTAPRIPAKDLDEIPFVYEDLERFENRIIYYETSRGCPFSCSYCLSSIDKKVRFRSMDLVLRELAFFLEHRVPQVKFVDRTFNCSHERTLAIWHFIREHDNGVTNFHFEIAADLLNEEELELLAEMRPGLVQLEIGVQTVNEQTLQAIRRTARFEKIAQRVRKVSEAANIHQHLDLIAGLPYEDFASFQHSFDTVYRLQPQELQLGFLKVLQGSHMYQCAAEYGILYRSRPPYEVLSTNWISCDELLRLKEVEEMLEIYYNSQQFRRTMEALTEHYAPFELYAALADYYKTHELEGKSYSRAQRFEILRDFIAEQKLPRQTFDELLLLDLYLRENAKSRPQWAPDLSAYQKEMILFFQREEQEHRYLSGYEGMTWKQMMRMTHLEPFKDDAGMMRWRLFDYQKRNPLTGDAQLTELPNIK